MTGTSLPTPTLRTARLRLRPFDDADANDLFALHSSAHVLRYWDAPRGANACAPSVSSRLAGRWHRGGPGHGWPWTVSPTDVHRLVQPEPVESGLPQRVAGYCFDEAAWATVTRRRPRAFCCGGHSARWT